MKHPIAHCPLPVALLLCVQVAAAQEPQRQRLTDEAIQAALELYNRSGTVRMMGDSRVPAGTDHAGDLVVLDGILELDGRVHGSVLVINGDVVLGPASAVDGRLMVIGGGVTGPTANVSGGITLYRGGFSYQLQDGVLVQVRRRATDELAAGREFDFGRTDIIVHARPGYNRVEGLPIVIGPRLTLGHANPTIFESLVTYRTASGLSPSKEDFGYSLRAEQFVGGKRALRVGVRAYSEIAEIESSGVSNRENSLAGLFLHHDFRDHYDRAGIAGYVRVSPPSESWSFTLQYSDERNGRVRPRRPFSFMDNDQPWREEPLAADGHLRALLGQFAYDTRNHEGDPAHGWWLRTELERGLGGSLHTTLGGISEAAPTTFLAATLDLRRYARISPGSRLAVRFLAAGSADGDALPVQRQRALGGEGSLPGFALHRFDCGGHSQFVRENSETYQRFYGCDRAILLQLDYQTEIAFLRNLRNTDYDPLGLLQRVRLAAFFDAGRAFTLAEARGVRSIGNDDFAADAGFGVRLGPVGFYWAVPLSGQGQTLNFFVRVGPSL